jgi:hypothetical protein
MRVLTRGEAPLLLFFWSVQEDLQASTFWSPSPTLRSGATRAVRTVLSDAWSFNPRPTLRSGAIWDLTYTRFRLLWFQSSPDAVVGRYDSASGPAIVFNGFQSSPDAVVGRYGHTPDDRTRCRCFNPRPTLWSGAILVEALERSTLW